MYCALVSLGYFQYGLDSASVGGFMAMPGFLKVFGYPAPKLPAKYGINAGLQTAITSMLQVGIITGSFMLGYVGDKFGRRYSFLFAAGIPFIGNTILIVATNQGAIIFGRIVFGIANGLFVGIPSVYIVEVTLPHMRTSIATFMPLASTPGATIGSIIDNSTKKDLTRLCYQIPLAIVYIIPVLFCIIPFIIPETPRWLVLKARIEDARKSLRQLRGHTIPLDLIEAELRTITQAVEEERQITGGKNSRYMQLLTNAERRGTLLTIAVQVFHSAAGYSFLTTYLTYFFQIAGVSQHFYLPLSTTASLWVRS